MSTASIALAAVGATALVIALTVVGVVYFRTRARRRRAPSAVAALQPETTQMRQTSPPTLVYPSNPGHLAVGQEQDARASSSIADLPISDSNSSLASTLAGRSDSPTQSRGPDSNAKDVERPARATKGPSPPPFGGPSFVSVSGSRANDRTSAQFWLRPEHQEGGSGKAANASSAVPADLLKNLGQLPSRPTPAAIQKHRSPRRGSEASTAESEALTPVLDEGIQYRIASGIFGDSMNSDLEKHMWLSNILDSALGPSSRSTSPQKSRASLVPGGKGRAGGSSSRRGSHLPKPTEPLPSTPGEANLSKSASVNSVNSNSVNRRNSTRIPVSRSHKLYESRAAPTAASSGQDLASYPSTSDVSSNSHHLSTIRSHAHTEFTAATSLASSDSLANAFESDAFIFKADKAQKMPAKTMTTSQVINVTSRSSRKGKSIGSSQDTSASLRYEAKEGEKARDMPATDLQVAAASPALTAPFATTFHRAVFPDSPAAGRQQVKAGTPKLLPTSSPMLAALGSSSPIKGNPKMGLAAQLKSKLSRAVASPTTLSTPQLNYVKSSSALNLSMPNTPKESSSPSPQDISPDTSIVRQEEWRINTDDSSEQLLTTVKRTSSDERGNRPRQSGLGIDGVETLEDDSMARADQTNPDRSQSSEDAAVGTSQSAQESTEPRSPTPSQWSMQDHRRQRNLTHSPIMQQDKWARSPPLGQTSCRQSEFSRDSPSLYEDADGKSFAGHSVTTGAYDFGSNFSPRMAARGVMSPLDRLDRSINHDRHLRDGSLQTTPVMSSGRFPGQSPSGLSPHSIVRAGSAKYRRVGEGVTHEYSHRGYSFASPRSDGGADMMSASSCGIPETEEMSGLMSDVDQAAVTRARLLQSVQKNIERESSQETVRLEEHLARERETMEEERRMREEASMASRTDTRVAPTSQASVVSSVVNEAQRSPRGGHTSKKPAGLSIFVGNNKAQPQQHRVPKLGLGMGIVSPMTPPYTPSTADKTSMESRRSEVLLSMMGMTGHSVQQDTVEELPHEEGEDTITELVSEGVSRTGTPGPGTPGPNSPFKLRPLSLSTSGSVLGAGPGPEMLSTTSPTKNALGFSPALNMHSLDAANAKRGSYFPSSDSGTMTPSPSTSSRELFLPGHIQGQSHLQPQTPLSATIPGGSPAMKRASYRVSNSFTSGFGPGSAGPSQPSTPSMKPYAQLGQAAAPNSSRASAIGNKRGSFAYHSSTIVPSLSSGGASGGPLLSRSGAEMTSAPQSGIAA